MSAVVLNAVLVSDSPAPGDADLVERFVVARDQAAFAELVRRHSEVVLGVCRRVLHDTHEIDDVFQATFLVLVRDAARVRQRKSLASWLYGVAYRLSLRVARQRRRRRETGLVDESGIDDDTLEKLTDRHDQQLLDIELNALPERYRQALVLRYLAGRSTNEIANELGTTVGTVEGLLKRGKDELRRRLMQRGITLGVALVAIQASQSAVQAAATESLIEATIQGSLAWNSGSNTPTPDLISDQAIKLAGKELFAMTTATKTMIAVGLTLGGIAVGMGGLNALTGSSTQHAEGAGLVTTMTVSQPAMEAAELLTISAEPSKKVSGNLVAGDDTLTVIRKDELAVLEARDRTSDSNGAGTARVKWDLKPRSANVVRIENALQEKTEITFTDQPLGDALKYLEDLHHIPIRIDHQALADEGISVDQNVNVVMSETAFKSVLNMLLEPLQLDYLIKNEVMVITTRDKAKELLETRVYDAKLIEGHTAHELMELIIALVEPDSWDNGQATRSAAVATPHGEGNGQVAKPGMMMGPGSSATNPSTPKDVSAEAPPGSMPGAPGAGMGMRPGMSGQPMAMMMGGMGAGGMGGGRSSWGGLGIFGNGQGNGVIRVAKNNTLIIRQTQRIHEEIVELLDQLK